MQNCLMVEVKAGSKFQKYGMPSLLYLTKARTLVVVGIEDGFKKSLNFRSPYVRNNGIKNGFKNPQNSDDDSTLPDAGIPKVLAFRKEGNVIWTPLKLRLLSILSPT